MKEVIVLFIIGVFLSVLYSLILALPVLYLWNAVIPQTFPGVRGIDFGSAWCLSLLCALLFKSSNSSSSSK